MISTQAGCKMALSLKGVTTKDHFGSDAFYANKRIFATVWHDKKIVNLRLSPDEQTRFLLIDGKGFIQIDNAWGKQGWTTVQVEFVDRKDFEEALKSAWSSSAQKFSRPKAALKTKRKIRRRK